MQHPDPIEYGSEEEELKQLNVLSFALFREILGETRCEFMFRVSYG